MASTDNTYGAERRIKQTATIANAQTASGVVDLGGATLLGFMTPATFTGVAITFNVGISADVMVPLRDITGTLISVPVTPSQAYGLDPLTFAGWQFVQLVSGTTEAAARDLTLTLNGI